VNPNYAGKTPRPLKVECHDGTPFVTIRCRCGYTLHLHESQTADIPADAEVASRCHSCGEPLVFPAGWFAEAFAQMREDGWIA
jgi:ribosomal protein S27E